MQLKNRLTGLGKRIRQWREARGISAEDASFVMGISIADLARIESGAIEQGSTYISQMSKLSQLLEVSMSLLLEDEWTPADERNLFLTKREEVEERAFGVLARHRPEPTLKETLQVRELIRERFELFWEEKSRGVTAWRRNASGQEGQPKFELDEIEIFRMLDAIRRRNPS